MMAQPPLSLPIKSLDALDKQTGIEGIQNAYFRNKNFPFHF